MDPNRGSIAVFEKASDAKAAGYTVPLTKKEASLASRMNRKQRRAWAAEQRKGKK